jgi:hypothetical protein
VIEMRRFLDYLERLGRAMDRVNRPLLYGTCSLVMVGGVLLDQLLKPHLLPAYAPPLLVAVGIFGIGALIVGVAREMRRRRANTKDNLIRKLNRFTKRISEAKDRAFALIFGFGQMIGGALIATLIFYGLVTDALPHLKAFLGWGFDLLAILFGLVALSSAWLGLRIVVTVLAGSSQLTAESAYGGQRAATEKEAKETARSKTGKPRWADHGYND